MGNSSHFIKFISKKNQFVNPKPNQMISFIVIAVLFSLSSAQIWNCRWPYYSFQTKQYGIIASRCADEGGKCHFPVDTTINFVFYGAAASWTRNIFTGPWGYIPCNNIWQGCDPLPGIKKYCHLIHEHTLRSAG